MVGVAVAVEFSQSQRRRGRCFVVVLLARVGGLPPSSIGSDRELRELRFVRLEKGLHLRFHDPGRLLQGLFRLNVALA